MIGVLIITIEKFQELLYQSVRHISQAMLSTIQIDLRATTISIPSAFDALQVFTVDLDKLLPEEIRNQGLVAVPYPAIVLASLKSCVRSQMLRDCCDAGPLMQMIRDCPDVVMVQ